MNANNDNDNMGKTYVPPKVGNRLFYIYGCFAKLFCYLFFGTGAGVLAVIVFPLLRLFVHPKPRFQRVARCVVCYTFKFFIGMIKTLGLLKVTVTSDSNGVNANGIPLSGKVEMRTLKSRIVVANHPSMLDVVFMISLMPNADCIVRGNLAHTVYAGVIRELYIVNTLGYEEVIELCKKSLATGTSLIIFPEGTRTPHGGTNPFKKGASRIAIDTKSSVKCVYIGGTEKYGLGKGDPFLSFSRRGRYHYDIHVLNEINIEDFAGLTPQIAAKRLTDRIHKEIATAAMRVDNRKI